MKKEFPRMFKYMIFKCVSMFTSIMPGVTVLQNNLVPRATCDPARSHEVTLEGIGMFCHLIGWRQNKRFSLIIMIMQPWYQVNCNNRWNVWRNNKDGRALNNISRGYWIVNNKKEPVFLWLCRHQVLHRIKLRKTVNVSRNVNNQVKVQLKSISWSQCSQSNSRTLTKAMMATHLRWYWEGPVNENFYCFILWGPVYTLLTMIWEPNKIITDRPPVHTVTALKSFENGAKLKRNAFQFENLIVYQIFGAC